MALIKFSRVELMVSLRASTNQNIQGLINLASSHAIEVLLHAIKPCTWSAPDTRSLEIFIDVPNSNWKRYLSITRKYIFSQKDPISVSPKSIDLPATTTATMPPNGVHDVPDLENGNTRNKRFKTGKEGKKKQCILNAFVEMCKSYSSSLETS